MNDSSVDLSLFSSRDFDRGRPLWFEILWRVVSAVFFQSPWVPFYSWKRLGLRVFGASVGQGVLIKPRVTITFPWRLILGDHVWIGEEAFVDSLAQVEIGSHSCVSQGAFLCTGNHDYHKKEFTLITQPIRIGQGSWIAARAMVGPGVRVGKGAVLCMGSVALEDLEPHGIYSGHPAKLMGFRNRAG